MKESSPDQASYIDRIRSWARGHAYGGSKRSNATSSEPTLPLSSNISHQSRQSQPHKEGHQDAGLGPSAGADGGSHVSPGVFSNPQEGPNASDKENAGTSAAPPSEAEGKGAVVNPGDDDKHKTPNLTSRFMSVTKKVLLHSWINVLLIFVPVGIAVALVPNMHAGVVFAMNAIAIIPLAGILSHATESVAHRLGDTLGALLNVSFGNAVELIIFIALVKNEIRIVQASLLGSILANLLLILGMAFFLGGLRYREQTAFHASFADPKAADANSLIISRGTSVILLLVYIIYLMFQLKSHAYMYESTPQHIIDEEATPGPAAAMFDTSSSDSSSSSDSDSDSSDHSKNTMSRRVKRAIRRRRRKSSVTSTEASDVVTQAGTSSIGARSAISPVSPMEDGLLGPGVPSRRPSSLARAGPYDADEAVIEEESKKDRKRRHKHSRKKHRRHRKTSTPIEEAAAQSGDNVVGLVPGNTESASAHGEPRRVDFAETLVNVDGAAEPGSPASRRPFTNIRGISLRPVAKSLAPPIFTQPPGAAPIFTGATGPVPRVRYGIRRTNSLPDRLSEYRLRAPGAMLPSQIPLAALSGGAGERGAAGGENDDISRKAAVVMLLISTALVAVCAEFMVDAIDAVVANSPLKEIFIGLIILPIVGNAAEHVTAVAVAMKNKMDLAIGVAVGSSIQIALFLTPLVVILGWIIGREMTLYFTLFETVCLFVSAFIVNFLVLDGRSNYLEGALLCSTYVIIALVAFYYPDDKDASHWGGAD
ncbi:hypothetical protein DL766_010082 [Monosporascus sp. MC13-8B]|uniref:Sodium/calcium exchanger membrane region domain-containing protein n=1 Tax=Monosporascus cannonballus TaxID=155416 RepID=A0ABY0H582_9PEZI|nr:hypothetical protein DL762_006846 [Monosporascus cannonballus]RYO85727.1 hypothetical protein DL763_006983 [Monosporascus cannonballus]RYP10959.1 hypothetical protein DL766_010082 [Monosporascus sp. MC13-8B]